MGRTRIISTKTNNYTITSRAYLDKTNTQWIRSNILETKLSPHPHKRYEQYRHDHYYNSKK
ncbi:hypothetical protein [Tenacibaculum sp. SDUM215027]|uniref:hypothetical protein n=1 Tax=Tenacibaculum sp. SDUM215027 TaxID=3422596 RepID=UPI003D31D457